MVVAGRPGGQRSRALVEDIGRDDAALIQQSFERLRPPLVVHVPLAVGMLGLPAVDGTDEALLELAPFEASGFVKGHGDAEQVALPRGIEDQLAVRPRRRGRPRDRQLGGELAQGTGTRPTPTMASRVTRAASSS